MVSWLEFQNPEVVAIAFGVLVFILVHSVMLRVTKNFGPSIIVGAVIGLFTSWKIYTENYLGESAFVILLILAALAVIVRIFFPFFKKFR